MVELILVDRADNERRLKDYFSEPRLTIPVEWGNQTAGLTRKPLRDSCKAAVHDLCVIVEQLTGKTRDRVREDLKAYLVRRFNELNQEALVMLIGDVIHA